LKPLLKFLGGQRWLRFGLRDRLIRQFHHPDKARSETFEQAFFGNIYPGNFQTYIDWSMYYYGAYEWEELQCMKDLIAPMKDAIVLDVGANIGHHSLFLSTLASRVHSFEPYPVVYSKIEEKINRNRISNITLHPLGLGNKNQVLPFAVPNNNNTGTGSFATGASESAESTMNLEVKRADDYLPAVGIHSFDFVKMDIEGFEIEALQGMEESLRQNRPICFFEWSQNKRVKGSLVPADRFPEDYRFFQFMNSETILMFFQTQNYRLRPLIDTWPDGNILAIPEERLSNYSRLLPLPQA